MAHQELPSETITTLAPATEPAEAAAGDASLDRPLFASVPINWESLAWVGLMILATVMRFYNVGVRAMSHDESLHTFYSHGLYNAGNYTHNPMMHGPFLFHVNAFMYSLFGVNDATSRIGPVLAGIGVVGMAYFFRRYIGRTGALLAGLLLTISPSLLFHSRYIRNDIYIALFTLIWIYGAFRYLDTRGFRWLVMMTLGMALGFITKENHFMGGAILGAFFAGLALWQSIRQGFLFMAAPLFMGGGVWYYFHQNDRDDLGLIGLGVAALVALVIFFLFLRRDRWQTLRHSASGDLAVTMLTLVMPFTAPLVYLGVAPIVGWEILHFEDWQSPQSIGQEFVMRYGGLAVVMTIVAALVAFFWFGLRRTEEEDTTPYLAFGQWAQLMVLFWSIQILFFTTFFTNFRNGMVTGVVGSLGYWLAQQEVARGGQPGYYYAMLASLYEFLPALLSLAGMAVVGYHLWRTPDWDPVAAGDLPDGLQSEAEAETEAEREGASQDASGVGEDRSVEAELAAPSFAPASVLVSPPSPADLLRENRVFFAIFGVWWVFASWAAYTVAGEKMPWLMTHIALPMCVFGGWYIGQLLHHIDWRKARATHAVWLIGVTPAAIFVTARLLANRPALGREVEALADMTQFLLALLLGAGLLWLTLRWIGRVGLLTGLRLLAVGLFSILLLLTVRFTYMLTYVNYDMATEYLVYAHASPDIKRMLGEIDLISERTVGDRNIEVAYDNDTSWPLSWYMLAYPNSRYYGDTPTPDVMDAPVIIVGSDNYEKVHPYVARDYVKRTYRLIWWPDQGYFNRNLTDFWNTIRDPEKLRDIWQIAFYRRYPDDASPSGYRDLTQWPTRHNFEMWVRRDLAAEIWDLSVAPVAGTGTGLGEQLRASEIDLAAEMTYNGLYADLTLNRPRGVATDEQGNRYIADTLNHRIVVTDADGNELLVFGSFCDILQGEASGCVDPDGSGPLQLGDGQFNEPWGVGVTRDGSTIFVADTWNHRVQVFDRSGQLLRKWGYFDGVAEVPGDPYALYGPRGLAVDLDGNVLVADTGNKRIVRYTPEGEGLEQIGGGGVIGGTFNEPSSVAVDPRNGDVFVADNWNQRIQKLTPDLQFSEEWLVPSWETQQRDDKPGIAVDTQGRVYVTDPTMFRVIVYSPEGEIAASFGAYGKEANQLTFPNGVAIDWQTNQALVADADSGRVLLYPALPQGDNN